MARGDSFVLKVKDEKGNEFLFTGICDSSFYNEDFSKWNNDKVGFTSDFQFAIDLMEHLDSIFGSSVWQLSKFPVVPEGDMENLDQFTQFFPGAYIDVNYRESTYLYYNKEKIPGIFKYIERDKWILFTDLYGKYSLPYGYCGAAKKNSGKEEEYYYIGVAVVIGSDNFIKDGKIDSSEVCHPVRLLIYNYTVKNTWKAYIAGLSLNPFTNGSFWDGKEITIIGSGDDPFNPGGNTEEGGGGGSFDNTSKPIEIPNLPPVSASSTGFISLYNPTLEELNNLSSYLWSDLFEIDGWKKLFANPMDAILGLSILPVSIPSGGTKEVKVGNIGTGISLTVASTQFVEVDCGSLDIKEYWGAYLDYEPYTQAQIFLPYIGTRPISVDEIMGKTLSVKYHIDILSGACCCFVKSGDSVLYTFNGQCSIPIPITGADYTSVVNGILTIASSAASMVATGGQTAPLIAAGAAEGATKTAVARGLSASASLTNSMISGSSGIASSLANQMKPQIAKSGSISGSAGLLNMQTPYLIITRPRQALPLDQNKFIGYPSLVTVQLTELTGYTEIQSIHLENIPATSSELDEIENLLKGGVIF